MASKRAAAQAPAEQPEAKRLAETLRRSGVTRADYMAVVNGIQMSGLPVSTRAMLIAALPNSLAVYADERAPQQERLVAMIGEVMEQVQGDLLKAIDVKNEEVKCIEESGSGLRKELEDTKVACARAAATTQAAKEQLDAARETASQCHAALQEKRRLHDKVVAEHEELTAGQDLFETVLAGEFEQLKKCDLPASADEVQRLIGSVQQLTKKVTLDVSLEATWAGVLGKTERSAFDNIVVEQLEKNLREKATEIAAAKDAINTQIGELSVAMGALSANAEAATQNQDSLEGNWNTARDEEHTATAAQSKAQVALDTLTPSMQSATTGMKAREDELQQFQAKTLAVFEALKQRVSPRLQKQVAAEAAAEAAAAAAQAAAEEAAAATEKEQQSGETEVAQETPKPENSAKMMVTNEPTQADVARAAVAEAGA